MLACAYRTACVEMACTLVPLSSWKEACGDRLSFLCEAVTTVLALMVVETVVGSCVCCTRASFGWIGRVRRAGTWFLTLLRCWTASPSSSAALSAAFRTWHPRSNGKQALLSHTSESSSSVWLRDVINRQGNVLKSCQWLISFSIFRVHQRISTSPR